MKNKIIESTNIKSNIYFFLTYKLNTYGLILNC